MTCAGEEAHTARVIRHFGTNLRTNPPPYITGQKGTTMPTTTATTTSVTDALQAIIDWRMSTRHERGESAEDVIYWLHDNLSPLADLLVNAEGERFGLLLDD